MTKMKILLTSAITCASFVPIVSAGAGAVHADPSLSCHSWISGSLIAPDTKASCTGSSTYFVRARQTCHYGFITQAQTGSWVRVGQGTSTTGLCGGTWMDGSTYELKVG